MRSVRIVEHIDNKILSKLNDGMSLLKAVEYLTSEYYKFSSREDFIKDCTIISIIDTWEDIPIKNRYSTFYALQALNRANNINWLICNRKKLPKISDIKLYRLLKFRERIIQGDSC